MTHALARSIAQLLFGGVVVTGAGLLVLLVRDAHRSGMRRVRDSRR